MADDIVTRLAQEIDSLKADPQVLRDAIVELERLRVENAEQAQDLFFMGAEVDKFAGENYEQYCEIKQLRADLDLYRKALELAMQEESDSSYNLLVLHWLEEARRG